MIRIRSRYSRRAVTPAWLLLSQLACNRGPTGPSLPDRPPLAPIVFARLDGNWDVYSVRADGTGLTRLTDYGGDDLYPAWFSNHTRIAFQSERAGGWVYAMNPDGSDVSLLYRNVLCFCMDAAYRFAIAPAGDRVALTPRLSNEVRVALVADSASHVVATGNQIAWSPDGALLGFTIAEGIGVVKPDGSGPRTLLPLAGAREVAWSPDQQRIAYSRDLPGQGTVLWIANADGTSQKQLTTAPQGSPVVDLGAAWSPDGTFLAFQREHASSTCAPSTCYDIMVIRADGTRLSNVTGTIPRHGVNVRPSW